MTSGKKVSAMKKTIFLLLLLWNFVVLYFSATHFFVTFADIPGQVRGAQVELAHLHHTGMEDMRHFLFPSFICLVVTMVINLIVAGVCILAERRR